MGKSIGSVFLELDRRMTEQSFKGLNGIVNKVVNNLKPVTLKLNTKDTTKEFDKLTKVLKDVQANINKINSSAVAAGGGSALTRQANDIRQAYNDIMKYQKQMGSLEIQLTKGNKGSAEIAELTAQLDKLKQKRDELQAAFGSKFSDSQNKAIAKSWEEIENKVKLAQAAMSDKRSAQEAAAAQKAFAAAEKEAAQAAKEQAKAEREASKAEEERESNISALESRIMHMVSLSAILVSSVRQLKQMVNTTIELDSAMTQLRIVTNNTEEEYSAYGKQIAQTAQEIGTSMHDLVDSTTVFARLGYSLSESTELSRLTAMLHNVGNIDISAAQSALTAITKAFSDAGSNVELAMDKMVVVGNNFPISVAELAEGMNNAGSALAAAGNSFDQSVALLTAANVTVQNVSKSSTGLRTIAARIRKTTTELDELGEVVNEAKYQKVIDLLTGEGVKLTENGEYRATYDILKDIADIWDKLSSMDQAAIAEQLAGSRQQNIFYSIINQFNEAENAMSAMQNSVGALSQANDKYMNSIEAHVNSFKAAYEELSSTIVDSNFAKGITDFGTFIINGLTDMFEGLDKIGGILPIVTGAVAALFESFGAKVGGRILANLGLDKVIASVKTLAASAGSLKSLMSGGGLIGAILGGLTTTGKIALVAAAVTAVISLISYISKLPSAYDKAVKKARELNEEFNETFGAGSRYDELTNKTRVLTDAEQTELEVLQALRRERERELEAANAAEYKEWRKKQDEGVVINEAYTAPDGSIWPTREIHKSVNTLNEYRNTLSQLDKEYSKHQLSIDEYRAGLDKLITTAEPYYNELVKYRDLVAKDDTLPALTAYENATIAFYENLIEKSKEFNETVYDNPARRAGRALDDYILARQSKGDDFYRDILPSAEYKALEKAYLDALEEVAEGTENAANKVKPAAERLKESLKNIWESEEFSGTREELEKMAHSAEGISADSIEELASKSEQLKAIMESTGISARFLANVLSREALTGDGFDLLTDKALAVDAAMQAIIDRTAGAVAAIDEFNKATAVDNADAAASYAQAYQKFLDDWESGRTGSNTVQAAVNTFFSPEQLESMGWDLEKAGEQLSSKFYQAVFSTEGDPGANFATYVKDNYNDAWKEAVEITENADGTFDIAVTSAQALADAMGTDVDVANAFIEAMGAWGTHLFATGEELQNLATSLGLLGESASSTESILSAINSLAADGLSGTEIKATLDALQDAGYIDTSGIDNLDGKITEAINKFGNLGDAAPDVEVTHNLDEVQAAAQSAQAAIDAMHGTNIESHHTIYEEHVVVGGSDAEASGTRNAPGGATLVNELGPELISDHGRAYIANGGKPAIVNLSRGALVLNAQDTRNALRGFGLNGTIGAMASGSKATFPSNYSAGGSYGGGGGSSKGSSSNSNSTDTTAKEESWFEKQYKYHKHLVEMDQELQEDFLEWLDDAYKRAYAEGVIDLDDYYKHQEEVYKGLQDLFRDYLNDVEHTIDLAERAGSNSSEIVNIYQTLLDDINAELTKAYANGLDENDDYVQYLQNQWYEYYDKMKDAREDAADDAKDSVDDLVQYRIKMLKQYIKNEVSALKEQLKNLKDFYDKQKQMLKDSADEEDYIEEQREKRKAVSDIQNQLSMLELDNSAWAQKRKAQLQEELEDAQKELNKFERDHAIEVASEQLDAAYEVQERAINARVDELEALADNPKYLYDQALKDVQNNSVALYEEMIEYNRAYGDGIDESITERWEQAYISLKNYADLYNEFYHGINLVNATGYQPGTDGNEGGNYVMRNPGGMGVKIPSTSEPEVFTSSDGSTYNVLDDTEAAIQAQLEAYISNIEAARDQILENLQNQANAALAGLTGASMSTGAISMGNIIIQGNATADTISEIRRAQRENVDNMLTALNKLYNS